MSLQDWRDLNLLSEVAARNQQAARTSERQRTRSLFEEIAALTLYRSTTTFWRGHAKASRQMQPSMARGRKVTKVAVERLLKDTERASLYWRQGMLVRGSTELEKLALLQHTGTHTPLLDLTAPPVDRTYCRIWAALLIAALIQEEEFEPSIDGPPYRWLNR